MQREHILSFAGFASARFRSQQFAVAIDTGPVAVDKGHGIATDRTVGRRSFVDSGKNGQFDIVFVHHFTCRQGSLPVITLLVGAFSVERLFLRSRGLARRQTSPARRSWWPALPERHGDSAVPG